VATHEDFLLTIILAYLFVIAFYALVVMSVIVLYLSAIVLIFVGTAAAMVIRAIFRSRRPQDPRRPSIRNRGRPGFDSLGRPRQARWSDRR
jgi:membrane protein implicated in regulation of membrane protease activity